MNRIAARAARTVPCPWCNTPAGRPCRTRDDIALVMPHPQRMSAWAQHVACCPTCQVTPGVPCHEGAIARVTVHHRRYQEAETTP